MRKGAIIVAMGVLAAACAWGGHHEVDTMYGSALDNNPKNYVPQYLVGPDESNLIPNVELPIPPPDYLYETVYNPDSYELIRHDPNNLNYNYLMFLFENDDYSRATLRWQIRVDSLADIYLYYWDGDSWEDLDQNTGGSNPDVKYVEVTDYFEPLYLWVLAVGATPDSGDDDMDCDVCDLSTTP